MKRTLPITIQLILCKDMAASVAMVAGREWGRQTVGEYTPGFFFAELCRRVLKNKQL
jgi:hypothetical protein